MNEPNTKELAIKAAVIAEEKKGKNVVVIDFSDKSVLYDYVIITSAMSRTETRAIASAIDLELKNTNTQRRAIQGMDSGYWILLDYGSIVVHVFAEQDREFANRGLRPLSKDKTESNYRFFYNLEELWKDVPRLDYNSLPETEDFRKKYTEPKLEMIES